MRRLLTWGLVFFLPLLVLPFGTSYFETPKVILAELCIALIALSFCLSERPWKQIVLNIWPAVGLFLLSIIQLVFSQDPIFFGNQFRFQGTLLFWYLLVWLVVGETDRKKIVHDGWKTALVILSWIAVSLWYYGRNAGGLWVGTMGEPNATAAVVVFAVPFFLFTPNQQRSRTIRGVGFVMSCLMVAAVQSRAGVIAIDLIVLFSWLLSKKNVTKGRALLICLVLLLLSLFLPFVDTPGALENRAEIWQTAWVAGWKHPLLGSGVGSVEFSLKRAALERSNGLRFQYVDSSHNLFLDWWIQGGIVGVLLLSLLLYRAGKTFVAHDEPLFLSALGGVVVMLLFNPVSVASLIHFWWLLGMGNRNKKPAVYHP